jgi:hypothetical protein
VTNRCPEAAGPLGKLERLGDLGRDPSRPQNPTRVAVLMDVADLDVVMSAMQTEAAAEACWAAECRF